jgi:hypothetical protein
MTKTCVAVQMHSALISLLYACAVPITRWTHPQVRKIKSDCVSFKFRIPCEKRSIQLVWFYVLMLQIHLKLYLVRVLFALRHVRKYIKTSIHSLISIQMYEMCYLYFTHNALECV